MLPHGWTVSTQEYRLAEFGARVQGTRIAIQFLNENGNRLLQQERITVEAGTSETGFRPCLHAAMNTPFGDCQIVIPNPDRLQHTEASKETSQVNIRVIGYIQGDKTQAQTPNTSSAILDPDHLAYEPDMKGENTFPREKVMCRDL